MTNDNWLNLAKKTFIVTGGSSGIGAAIVQELLADGANVVDADLHAGTVTHTHFLYVQTDVTQLKQFRK